MKSFLSFFLGGEELRAGVGSRAEEESVGEVGGAEQCSAVQTAGQKMGLLCRTLHLLFSMEGRYRAT